jgi:hypothetical protein
MMLAPIFSRMLRLVVTAWSLCAGLVLWPLSSPGATQTAAASSAIRRVYVGSLGNKPGAAEIRERLEQRLKKSRTFEVVENADAADAILSGTGEIWITGYYRTNPKPSPWNRQAAYDGYLSVELRTKDRTQGGTWRVTHGKFIWDDITEELAKKMAKEILPSLERPAAGN